MKLKIFGATWCSPCRQAKSLCEEHDIEYEFFNIDEPENREKASELLGEPLESIPCIFSEDGYIGGLSQLKELIK